MKSNRPVMIVENSTSNLQLIKEANSQNKYTMSGIFTEFDVENRNKRVYNAQQFLPHLNEMMERKKSFGAVYGEFDHPDVFDTSLSRVSHVIENATFNETENRIDGQIRLLSTYWGKEARSIVDDGLPIFVSSRAAGITEGNGQVSVKKLFTYDAVADPGFASTRMKLDSMNESYGFSEDNTCNFRIYDITNESKFNELVIDNNNKDLITKAQMDEYSSYISEQINQLKTNINENVAKGELPSSKMKGMVDMLENFQEQQEKIQQYLDYLGEKLQTVYVMNSEVTSKTEKLEEKTDNIIKHNDYLAEKVEKTINYAQYIAETLDKTIDFSEYIAEHVEKNIAYSEYLGENIQKNIDYSNYIAENLDNNIAYSEYLGENLNTNIESTEKLTENVENVIEYSNYLAENLDNGIAYSGYLAEHIDNNIAYSEYIAENVSDTQAYQNYLAESLDKTVDYLKNGKVNEAVQMPDYKTEDVQKFYNDGETQTTTVQTQPDGTTVQTDTVVQPDGTQVQTDTTVQPDGTQVQTTQVQAPVQEPVQPAAQPVQGEKIIEEIPVEGGEEAQVPTPPESVENMPIVSTEIVPGMTVDVDGNSAQILSYNPENGIATVQLNNVEGQEGVVEVAYENIIIEGEKIVNENKELKSHISDLISGAKKRKAEENNDPHFLNFLTENKREAFKALNEDQQKAVKVAFMGKSYYSSDEVLNIMSEALAPEKTFEELLISNIPTRYKDIFEGLDNDIKNSLVAQAKLYPSLDTEEKMEFFWESRKLENYVSLNETKEVVLNENKVFDDSELSDEALENIYKTLKAFN